MTKSNIDEQNDIPFFPSKVVDQHAMLVPEEEFRRLSQSSILIKDLQDKVASKLNGFKKIHSDLALPTKLAHYAIEVLETAISFLQQIRCHQPDETFLDEVFVPFLRLYELMGEVEDLRGQYTDWPQKYIIYPFSHFSKASALDTAITFTENIYNSGREAARQLEMLNEQDVFDSLTVMNICWDTQTYLGKTIGQYSHGGKPQRRFIDWQTAVISKLEEVSLDHVDQNRTKVIEMINEELNEVITKKDGSQARENIFSSNSVESLEKEETIANHTGLDGIDDEAVFSPAKIAEICGILQEPLRKRLERKRKKDHTCFIEISERGSQEAQYLYKVGKIREITEEMMKE